jgi:hypothetical protein
MAKTFLFALLVSVCIYSSLSASHPEAKLEFEPYCAKFNYPLQKHEVITDDGYILTVYRIQKKGTDIV